MSLRTISVTALLCVSLGQALSAAEKNREWQTGTVVDYNTTRSYAGTHVSGGSGTATSNTAALAGTASTYSTYNASPVNAVPMYAPTRGFLIRTDKYIFVCAENGNKPARLIVNGHVRFYLDQGKLVFTDEDHKTHKTSIVKQVLIEGMSEEKIGAIVASPEVQNDLRSGSTERSKKSALWNAILTN
jgi:hypothetical protein